VTLTDADDSPMRGDEQSGGKSDPRRADRDGMTPKETGEKRSRPLVSVVLPTYNRPEELRRAAASVADQTYPAIELVVVDDCSERPARETLADIDVGHVSVRHVRHEVNRGANAARNSGIRAATGEYVAFLDDDDEWHSDKLARQVATFVTGDADVGVVYTGMRFVRPDGTRDVLPRLRGDVTEALLVGRSLSQFSAVMVRRAVIDQAGLPDERFPSWQDREWYLRLSQHCAFEPVVEPLCVRRLDSDDRISDDFERKRDVSYPLFVETHRPLAREHGLEGPFLAAAAESLGKTALQRGAFGDARRFLLRALRADPIRTPRFYAFLASALGGRPVYRVARRLARSIGV
jgi:glycosyltransferase involved in cell wall biosynthesis